MTTLIRNAHKVDAHGESEGFWALLDDGGIAATGIAAPTAGSREEPTADEVVDARGAFLVPGFLDLHGHGGGGSRYDDGAEGILAALATHRAHGTTRSVISLVTSPLSNLRRGLADVAELAADPLVLGSHLEGPFLANERRGAHDPEFLRHPVARDIDSLLEAAAGTLRQVTIAPELPGASQAIDAFVDAGVVVAVGHTAAGYDLAREAFDRGARLLTHAFNAMPGLHHRSPGPVGAAFADQRVTLELVLDGHHVHPEVAAAAFAAAPGRIALVTDAMAAAGAQDGDYRLGSLAVEVRGGRALLAGTETIAGSTLTQDAALRRAVREARRTPVEAVTALTLTPARALGLSDRLGLLAPGFAADAVLLDADWRVRRVWADGRELVRPA